MKKTIFMIFFFQTALGSDIILHPGENKKLDSPASKMWVKEAEIIKIQNASKFWILEGLKKGSTSLHSGQKKWNVHVISPWQQELYDKISRELNLIPGPDLKIQKGQITLTGHLYRFEDWLRISKVAEDSNSEFYFESELTEQVKSKIKIHIQKVLNDSGLLPLTIFFSPNPEVRVSRNDKYLEKYREKLKPYGIRVQIDEKAIDLEPVIRIEMTVLEINKNHQSLIGIEWPSQATAEISPNLVWDKLNFSLNFLQQKGEAQILASPNLLCRSGKECQFFVGGEFPIKLIGAKTKEVLWKNYGIMLKFNPLADQSGRMSLGLQSEISYLDPSLKIEDIPALKTNRLNSHFDLDGSQVISLSGLLREQTGQSENQSPWLADIPILGALFKSQNYINNKSELIILVRPSLVTDFKTNPLQHLEVEK